MRGGSILDWQPAILSDASPQFFKEDVGAPLIVGVRLDESVIETRREVQVEVGADMLGFDERPGHRPESHDGSVIHDRLVA